MPWRASAADLNEDEHLLGEPLVSALNVAVAKARATRAAANEVVLAADTLVVSDSEVLAKPRDAQDARAMLRRLRGRPHRVLTGVAVCGEREWGGVVSTSVFMRGYSDAEVDAYIERGEPFDKAGGYAVQDTVFSPVERLEGCYLNVVGLPLCAVAAGLASVGIEVERAGSPPCGYCELGKNLVEIR